MKVVHFTKPFFSLRPIEIKNGDGTDTIFRQAKNLLDKRDAGGELSWEEFQLIATAEIPLAWLPLTCEDMAVRDCLEVLAEIVEEAD